MPSVEFMPHSCLWGLVRCCILYLFAIFSVTGTASAEKGDFAVSINRPFQCWNQQLEDEFQVAKVLYQNGWYDKSARILTTIDRKCSTPFVLLGIGVSILRTGDCSMALLYFHKFLDSSIEAARIYSFHPEVERALDSARANVYERLSECPGGQSQLTNKTAKQNNGTNKILALGISSGLLGVSMLAIGIGLNFSVLEKKAAIQMEFDQDRKEQALLEHNQLRAASISSYSLGSILSVTSLVSVGTFWRERRR